MLNNIFIFIVAKMTVENQNYTTADKNLFLSKSLNQKEFSSQSLPYDASTRRYERITSSQETFILMDASLDKNTIKPFMFIADLLYKNGYSAPKIFTQDKNLGFLLLEDLGEISYASLLTNPSKEDLAEIEKKLYKKAIDLLIDLHKKIVVNKIEVSSYKKEFLTNEAVLLVDWYIPTLTGSPISENLKQEYIQAWDKIFNHIYYAESCLVLRDYHIDNLMWLEDRQGIKKVGLLDFQDAVKGSYAYDVVSLLEDARRDVNEKMSQELLEYYISQMEILDRKKFLSDYKILGTQRSCKIVGIFTRKAIRDNDTRYLKHLSRVWGYIKKHINHPILEPLRIWFQKANIPVMNISTL
ncbi:MAG: phosphotransferase [Rickettsiales bacterium]|nr:phosphotransferase [Rickettsiales bacterium]